MNDTAVIHNGVLMWASALPEYVKSNQIIPAFQRKKQPAVRLTQAAIKHTINYTYQRPRKQPVGLM